MTKIYIMQKHMVLVFSDITLNHQKYW